MPGAAGTAPVPALDLVIDRTQRTHAPFPLQITGVDGGERVRVIVRDLPEQAWLSQGERRDEHTWALRLRDLENLNLTLNDGTPDAFELNVDVVSADGTAQPASLAKARVKVRTSAPALSIEDLLARSSPQSAPSVTRTETSEANGAEVVQHSVRPAAAVSKTGVQPKVATAGTQLEARAQLQRPEGMSGLGAVSHEPSGDEARKVWWRMPAPEWSPFSEHAARR
jgi:hypothetical protein